MSKKQIPPPTPKLVRTPQPFLKWAGGKRRLLGTLHSAEPVQYTHLVEPFIGGGAFYFSVDLPGSHCLINDINPELTNAYVVVRDHVEDLIFVLTEWQKDSTKGRFEEVRALDPTSLPLSEAAITRAARAIYLNKTCFNGLWRENASGGFNVPWGQKVNAVVCEPEKLRAASRRLAGTVVRNQGVEDLLNGLLNEVGVPDTPGNALLHPGTLVYLDPPYIPLTRTASFASYSKGGYGEKDQKALAVIIERLTATHVKVLFSNSDTALTREIYSSLDLIPTQAPRSIAAAGGSRKSVGEVLGINYPRSAMHTPNRFPVSGFSNAAATSLLESV